MVKILYFSLRILLMIFQLLLRIIPIVFIPTTLQNSICMMKEVPT